MSLPIIEGREIWTREPFRKFTGHTALVRNIIHLPGGQRILTCSEDGSLRLWNSESGLQIGRNWRDGKSAVVTMALSPDGRSVASGSDDGAVRLWDVKTGKVIGKWTGHRGVVWSVSWSQDARQVVSGSIDGTARVWDERMRNGEVIHGIINTGHIYVFAVAFSPDKTMIATGGSGDEKINIWNAKTFGLVKTLKGHKEHVYSFAWAADGGTLISGSADGISAILTWNTTTWEQQITFLPGHTDVIRAIAISPDQRTLASASWDQTTRLWNAKNGQPVGQPLQHAGDVNCVSFSADGRLLATGCDDNAYIWDISAFVEEAGLDHRPLLQVDSDGTVGKSVLDTKGTRGHGVAKAARPLNDKHRLPAAERILGNRGDRIHHPSTRSPPRPYSSSGQASASCARTFLDRFSSLFRRSHSAVDDRTHPTQTPFSSLIWTLAPRHFSPLRRSDDERRLPTVDAPCTRGLPRYIKVTQGRQPKRTPPVINTMVINITDISRPPMSDAVQHPSDLIHCQELLPQPQHFHSTVHAHAITKTTSPPAPVIIIKQPGCWTRFWHCLGCISFDETPGSH